MKRDDNDLLVAEMRRALLRETVALKERRQREVLEAFRESDERSRRHYEQMDRDRRFNEACAAVFGIILGTAMLAGLVKLFQ